MGGVFHDLKNYAYQQPYPMYIDVYRDIVGNAYMCWQYKYIIKLKEGVDVPAFRHRMEREADRSWPSETFIMMS